MERVLRRLAVGIFGCAFAGGACQLIAGIDDREVKPCVHAYLPEASTPPTDDGNITAVYALNLSFSASRSAGFDLDDVCSTGTAATNGCTPACGSGVSDDSQGRDNAAGGILSGSGPIGLALASTNVGPNDRYRMLLRLTKYNGLEEDSQVSVELFRSHGIAPLSPDTAVPPANDGNDEWTVTEDSFLFGGTTAEASTQGFVTGRRVIAQFGPNTAFKIPYGAAGFAAYGPAGHIVIDLQRGALSIPLPPAGQQKTTGGVIAGVWQVENLLTSVSSIKDPRNDDYLCGDAGHFLRGFVCSNADFALAGTRCDGLSVAFDVESVAAKLGDAGQLAPPVSGCGPTWTDNCNKPESCAFFGP